MFKQNLPDMHVVMLQITLLKGILEENGVDLAAVLSSAGVALTEEASSEYDDDDEEEDEEEEEAEEDMVASTAEGEAQSPGMAQSNFGLYRLLCICKAQIYLHAPALVYTGCEMFNIVGSRCCRWTIVHTAFLDGYCVGRADGSVVWHRCYAHMLRHHLEHAGTVFGSATKCSAIVNDDQSTCMVEMQVKRSGTIRPLIALWAQAGQGSCRHTPQQALQVLLTPQERKKSRPSRLLRLALC